MFHRLSINTTFLAPAVIFKGKMYSAKPGQTHLDALKKIPGNHGDIDPHDPEVTMVFVNQNGRVFDRRRAYEYAVENDLVADWAEGPFLIAEEMWGYDKNKAHLITASAIPINKYWYRPGLDPSDRDNWKDVKKNLVPAIRDNNTGDLYIGKKGETHSNIRTQNKIPYFRHDDGFYDIVNKGFYSQRDIDLDSTDLMTPTQMFRWQQEPDQYEKMATVALQEPLNPGTDDTNMEEPDTQQIFQFGNPGG